MRIDEIAQFRALAAEGYLALAADALGISQSTLSRTLAKLEAEAGVELFDRRRGRLELNQYGEILLAHAVRAETELENARARIDALRDPSGGTVSIAYVSSFGGWLIPRVVREYRALFPDIRFVLRGGTADTVLDALREGSADLAFLSPDPRDPDIDWHPLTAERLVLGVPVGHPLADRASVTVADLDTVELVALRPGSGLRHIADAYFSAHGVVLDPVIEVTELATLRALVRDGVGVALIPDAPADPGIVAVPLADEASRIVGLARNRTRSESAAAAQFARFVREEYAVLPEEDRRGEPTA
ncbi:LysR family transcriptional regulator [Leifsonia sp. F6_8S_P_1B]|uniref:LysR family transcriptional regulator n=1 Tax=Leifsonia williamsii TaxID=3035919 RepID=A0ABT8KIK1_9MICO|nr:LysR family transcriptional regulator [Leifsonia williamsii]MDN4616292.1 LysR family transcriptional regulator [Leifsonia williamsii]